jgi:hypothetical protein
MVAAEEIAMSEIAARTEPPVQVATASSAIQSGDSSFSTRKAVVVNRILTTWLCVLVVFDVAFNRTNDLILDAVISLPLAVLFAIASTNLSRGSVPSKSWLNISGGTCLVFGSVSALSFPSSLTASPTDYACAFWAATMAGVMAYGAWYQIRLARGPGRN